MVYSFTLTIDFGGFTFPNIEFFDGGMVISFAIFHLLLIDVDRIMESRKLEKLN